MMIRALLAATIILIGSFGTVRAQSAGVSNLEISLWQQAQQFLSNCSDYPQGSADGQACETSRLRFTVEYYRAMMGDVDDQWDMSYMMMQSAPSAVINDPMLACAWMIVFDDSGGDPRAGADAPAVAAGCRKVPASMIAADAIEAQMIEIKKTGHI